MQDERSPGAGQKCPGTQSFPFGLVSNAFAAVAVVSMLVAIVTESDGWPPFELWGLPGSYCLAALASLVTGMIALARKPWRGVRSLGGTLVWLFVLTPFFPFAIVLLFLAAWN